MKTTTNEMKHLWTNSLQEYWRMAIQSLQLLEKIAETNGNKIQRGTFFAQIVPIAQEYVKREVERTDRIKKEFNKPEDRLFQDFSQMNSRQEEHMQKYDEIISEIQAKLFPDQENDKEIADILEGIFFEIGMAYHDSLKQGLEIKPRDGKMTRDDLLYQDKFIKVTYLD